MFNTKGLKHIANLSCDILKTGPFTSFRTPRNNRRDGPGWLEPFFPRNTTTRALWAYAVYGTGTKTSESHEIRSAANVILSSALQCKRRRNDKLI